MSNIENKTFVSTDGYEKLKNELEYLIHTVREEVKEELQLARAQGDLSENADYDAARERQAKIEARIKELDAMLSNIEIIDESKSKAKKKKVSLGCLVKILELDTNEEFEYRIVGSVEADPINGKLSNVSPLAIAILDKAVNDEATVRVASPYKVKILSIK